MESRGLFWSRLSEMFCLQGEQRPGLDFFLNLNKWLINRDEKNIIGCKKPVYGLSGIHGAKDPLGDLRQLPRKSKCAGC